MQDAGRRLAIGRLRCTCDGRRRWTTGQRQQLEQRYSLSAPQQTEGRTFAYALTDVSGANVRALVLDPAVEDTHEINRTSLPRGLSSRPRLPYATAYPSVPAATGCVRPGCVSSWASRGRPCAAAWPALAATGSGTRIPGRLARSGCGVPDRVRHLPAGRRLSTAGARRVGRRSVQRDLARPARAAAGVRLRPVDRWTGCGGGSAFWGVLFIAGAFAPRRVRLSGRWRFCLGVALHDARPRTTPSARCCWRWSVLQWSRWSDAWSVDAWRRGTCHGTRRRSTATRSGSPGLVLGVVFAAAAVAKLRDAGVAWILNGTVKYHFLSDSPQAMVDWGLWIGRAPLAVGAPLLCRDCDRGARHRRRPARRLPIPARLPASPRCPARRILAVAGIVLARLVAAAAVIPAMASHTGPAAGSG